MVRLRGADPQPHRADHGTHGEQIGGGQPMVATDEEQGGALDGLVDEHPHDRGDDQQRCSESSTGHEATLPTR